MSPSAPFGRPAGHHRITDAATSPPIDAYARGVKYADRFDPQRYEHGEVVEVRGYRGARRASIRREHVVNEDLFDRVLLLASAYKLHQVGSLDGYGPTELNKTQARSFADELGFLRTAVNDTLLEPHLAAMQAVADFCWRTTEDGWMVVEGP